MTMLSIPQRLTITALDLPRLWRYLRAVAAIARHGADTHDLRELLAVRDALYHLPELLRHAEAP